VTRRCTVKRARERLGPPIGAGVAAAVLIVCFLAVFGTSGCGGVVGSGKLVTTEIHQAGFTEVKAADSWTVTIVQGTSYSVKVTSDDNMVDHLDVKIDGSALVLGVERSMFIHNVTLRATIVMPTLSGLDLSDASEGSVTGFSSEGSLAVSVHDASSVELTTLSVAKLSLQAADGSSVSGSIQTDESSLRLRDGSDADLSGSTRLLTLEVSDGSTADLSQLRATDVSATISDGSRGTVSVDGTLNARVTDGSELEYVGSPRLGSVHASDDSSLTRAGQ
jgi:hypothetical protein